MSITKGSLPKLRNTPFLDTLKLRTVISLTPKSLDEYEKDGSLARAKASTVAATGGHQQSPNGVVEWISVRGIDNAHIKVGKAKDGALPFTPATVKLVLEMLMDRERYPIYLHDLDGSDVLSMMGAALRKLQGWSERAWLEEMSRFLRQPPPEPEHLTFLRRLLSSALPQSDPPVVLVVPSSSKRVPWLWPQGLPTAPAVNGKKSLQHISMRVKVQEDEQVQVTKEGSAVDKRVMSESRDRREQTSIAAPALVQSAVDTGTRGPSASRTSITSMGSDSTLRPTAVDGDRAVNATSAQISSLDEQSEESTLDDSVSQRFEDEDEEEEDEELWDEDEDDAPVLSQTIEALDLG
ncbi:hypothetical protein ACM66B_005988 [Microbotryomycetes sp. NB124-2]